MRELHGKDDRFIELVVVARPHRHGLLAHLGEHGVGDRRELRLGVTGGRRSVAVDGAEGAVAVDEAFAHDPLLGHADERIVDGDVAVGMELAEDVARDAHAFGEPAIGEEAELVIHRVEDASLDRLEAIADIGERARRDDGEGISKVTASRLFDDRRRVNRLGHPVLLGKAAIHGAPPDRYSRSADEDR